MSAIDKTAMVLIIIGAINWLAIGIAKFNLVGALFGGDLSIISRIIYTLVGLAGLWAISILTRTPFETR